MHSMRNDIGVREGEVGLLSAVKKVASGYNKQPLSYGELYL